MISDYISIDSIATNDDIIVSIDVTVDASNTDNPDSAIASAIEAIQIQDDAYDIFGEGNLIYHYNVIYFWNVEFLIEALLLRLFQARRQAECHLQWYRQECLRLLDMFQLSKRRQQPLKRLKLMK